MHERSWCDHLQNSLEKENKYINKLRKKQFFLVSMKRNGRATIRKEIMSAKTAQKQKSEAR